jgi:hypothetical protein
MALKTALIKVQGEYVTKKRRPKRVRLGTISYNLSVAAITPNTI